MKTKKGFTLMELIVTIAILGVVLSVVYNVLFFQIKTFNMSDRKSVAQTDVRYISDFIANEVRYSTDIEILKTLPSSPDANFKYLYVENNQIYYRNYGDIVGHKLNIENRNPLYNLTFLADKDNIVNFDLESNSENYKINSSINLINAKVGINNGSVIKYKLPDFDAILSFLDKSNKFWYDLVRASLDGSLNTAAGYNSTQQVNSGILKLNVTSTGTSNGGASMFVPIDADALKDANADNGSYSIIVDAKVNGGKGGYGILINGVLSSQNKDTGYMFQFDPGARGFVLREINGGTHVNTANIGAKMKSGGNSYNLSANAIYSPSHLENAEFKWPKETLNTDSDWFKRYKTEVKAQTQKDGSLVLRAVIIDEAGHRSNEMWFGDFGEVTLKGSTFQGQKLGTYANKGGDIFGLRVWDNSEKKDVKANTDFYSIAIGTAEPAPKKTVTKTTAKKVTINFDDKIGGDISSNKDLFVVKDINGNVYDISAINKANSDYDIDLSIVPKKDINGNDIIIPENLNIEYKKVDEVTALKDSFGNLVNDFKFDKGIYIKQ